MNLATIMKSVLATTLLGPVLSGTSVGQTLSGVAKDVGKSFFTMGDSKGKSTAVSIQGPIDSEVFTFSEDLRISDIPIVDSTKSTANLKVSNNTFPMGKTSDLNNVIRDPAFRRYVENSLQNNDMKKLAFFRDLSQPNSVDEEPIQVLRSNTLIV